MKEMIIISILVALLLLPIIFRNRISKNIYALIAVTICTNICIHFNIVRPADGILQFGLALLLVFASVILYSNSYFLFRKKQA